MKKIIVAIDGFSACGKSTTAKALAEKLGYVFIDSGAMYRATTMYFLDNHITITNFRDTSSHKTTAAPNPAAIIAVSIAFAKEPAGAGDTAGLPLKDL